MKKIIGCFLVLAIFCGMAAGQLAAQRVEIPHVTAKEFGTLVRQNEKPVLVQFDAVWCPYCRALQPDLQKLSQQKHGKLVVVRLDTDKEPELTVEYEIKSLPTLIIFQNGQILGRHDGAPKGKELFDWADEVVGQ